MWAPLFAGTLCISCPNKLMGFMYFVSGAALKWVRVVTGEKSKHLAQPRQNTCKTQNQWDWKCVSKDKIQTLRQNCQNVQIKSRLQRKDKILVTFFFWFHSASRQFFLHHLCAMCKYEHIQVYEAYEEGRPTRCNNYMFIINFCLNMFRASSYPSSGEQRPCYCIWCVVLVLLDVVGSGCGALRCRMRAVK